MVIVSAMRPLSTLELVLSQLVSLALGIYGSYKFGQNAARESAKDVVRPHARSAVRSLLGLRDSLYRLWGRVEDYRAEGDDYRFEVIQAIIEEQVPTGDSAIEDWRDIAVEDVDDVIRSWEEETEEVESGNENRTDSR